MQAIFGGYKPATVVNFGLLSAFGTSGIGIKLVAGGAVTNVGTILGTAGGVKIGGAASTTTVNYGRITNRASAPFAVYQSGFTSNFLSNSSAGYIGGNVTQTGTGVLVNAGTIAGSVDLTLSGTITNGASGSTSAAINGDDRRQ